MAGLCSGGVARAGGTADAYRGIAENAPVDAHGLVDLYAQTRLDTPSRAPAYRAFDPTVDGPALGFARVTVAHRPDALGFRIDAGAGDTADAYLRSDPAASFSPALARVLSYLEQAFVSASLAPGGVVSLDLGKFGTPVGFEDNESLEAWNYSRSLLFTLGEPTYHTGLRATYRATDRLALSVFWLNGWNTNVVAGNGMRSFAVAATWRPKEAIETTLVYAGGLERAPTRLDDPSLAFRHELSGEVVYTLADRVSLAATSDCGVDAAGGGATFWGVGGYIRARGPSWFSATLRGEHFADPDGFASGKRQWLAAATATLEARGSAHDVLFVGRVEYRRDRSDAPVFPSAGRPATHQDTLTVSLAAAF
jgi:hypothetical protein